MKDLLIRLLVVIIATAICLPGAYLGFTHGSSSGLEIGLSCVVLNGLIVYFMIKLKGKEG